MDSFLVSNDNFENIKSVIENSQVPLNDLALETNVFLAFRKLYQPLIKFILSQITEITDITLYETEMYPEKTRHFFLNILAYRSPGFATMLSNNRKFLLKMNAFISRIETISEKGLSIFSIIMESLIKTTNGMILMNFPEKNEFVDKLLIHINSSSIFSLIQTMAECGGPNIYKLFDGSKLTQKLISDEMIEKSLVKSLILLKSIVNHANLDSELMARILDDANLEKIFDIALNNKDCTANTKAFDLLLEICKVCADVDESECEEEDEFHIFGMIMERIPEICGFITKEQFNRAKYPACELLVGILPALEELTEDFYHLLDNLFNQMIQKPNLSILNCAFMKILYAVINHDESLFQKLDFRTKIVEVYNNKSSITQNQYSERELTFLIGGYLHEITSLIRKQNIEFLQECAGWDDYINTIFLNEEKIITTQYGGPVPKEIPSTSLIVDF